MSEEGGKPRKPGACSGKASDGVCPGGEIAHSGTGKMEVEGLEYFLKSVPMFGSQ